MIGQAFMSFWSGFRQDVRAMISVELAMAMPVLAGLLLSGAEVTRYVLLNQKIERTTASVADLVSQAESLSEGDMTNLFQITALSMDPFPFVNDGRAIVSSISASGGNPPTINWQRATGGGPCTSAYGAEGGTATLPSGLTVGDGENIIVTEVCYSYQPLLVEKVMTAANLYNSAVYRPRFGTLTAISP